MILRIDLETGSVAFIGSGSSGNARNGGRRTTEDEDEFEGFATENQLKIMANWRTRTDESKSHK